MNSELSGQSSELRVVSNVVRRGTRVYNPIAVCGRSFEGSVRLVTVNSEFAIPDLLQFEPLVEPVAYLSDSYFVW